jgi:hypothetical protein
MPFEGFGVQLSLDAAIGQSRVRVLVVALAQDWVVLPQPGFEPSPHEKKALPSEWEGLFEFAAPLTGQNSNN